MKARTTTKLRLVPQPQHLSDAAMAEVLRLAIQGMPPEKRKHYRLDYKNKTVIFKR